MHKRLRIVGQKEFDLSPIAMATKIVAEQVIALHKELEKAKIETKTLGGKLSGALMLQVNEGPTRYCELFLDPEECKKQKPCPTPEEVDQLRLVMSILLRKLYMGLKAYEKHMLPEEKYGFEVYKEGYAKLEAAFKEHDTESDE